MDKGWAETPQKIADGKPLRELRVIVPRRPCHSSSPAKCEWRKMASWWNAWIKITAEQTDTHDNLPFAPHTHSPLLFTHAATEVIFLLYWITHYLPVIILVTLLYLSLELGFPLLSKREMMITQYTYPEMLLDKSKTFFRLYAYQVSQ